MADKSQAVNKKYYVVIEYVFDTSSFSGQESVSLGSTNESNLGDFLLKFDENTITGCCASDESFLRYTMYLNLRSSLFKNICSHHLQCLLFIDIAYSLI